MPVAAHAPAADGGHAASEACGPEDARLCSSAPCRNEQTIQTGKWMGQPGRQVKTSYCGDNLKQGKRQGVSKINRSHQEIERESQMNVVELAREEVAKSFGAALQCRTEGGGQGHNYGGQTSAAVFAVGWQGEGGWNSSVLHCSVSGRGGGREMNVAIRPLLLCS